MKQNIESSSHIRLTYITHFFCDEPDKIESIDKLLENFANYPADVLDHTHLLSWMMGPQLITNLSTMD